MLKEKETIVDIAKISEILADSINRGRYTSDEIDEKLKYWNEVMDVITYNGKKREREVLKAGIISDLKSETLKTLYEAASTDISENELKELIKWGYLTVKNLEKSMEKDTESTTQQGEIYGETDRTQFD